MNLALLILCFGSLHIRFEGLDTLASSKDTDFTEFGVTVDCVYSMQPYYDLVKSSSSARLLDLRPASGPQTKVAETLSTVVPVKTLPDQSFSSSTRAHLPHGGLVWAILTAVMMLVVFAFVMWSTGKCVQAFFPAQQRQPRPAPAAMQATRDDEFQVEAPAPAPAPAPAQAHSLDQADNNSNNNADNSQLHNQNQNQNNNGAVWGRKPTTGRLERLA